ncbi:MAG: hypothetical protein IKO00_13345 [Oscillospiraceae bacterium]|nr:hypothetical protein [Oscillospiraceae bacterium]
MNSTSSLYNSIYSGIHRFEVKVNIAGTDYGMNVLTSLNSRRSVFGSGSPRLGLAPAGELSLSLYLDSGSVPRMAEIRPYFRVVNDSRQSEWIAKGVYFVDTREADTTTGLLTLQAYDSMLKGEVKYPSTSHAWPYSDINTVTEIASFLGVAVDAQTTSLMTAGFMIPLPAQYTLRETLQYIGALYGGSFVITDANTLRLIPLWSVKTSEDAPLGGTHRLTAAPAFPACTGVRFLVDNDQELFAGDETGYVYEISCPFATQAAADRLLTKLQGFIYRPFTAEAAVINPACELGDTVAVPDGLGGTFLSGLFSSDLVFDSLCAASVSAPEDEELDHEYPYIPATERSFTRRIQNVQSELTLQAQQIAAKVSRTGGDASSFGWYLDADKFQLVSNGSVVMLVNRDGLSVEGVINATSGEIGGCTIQDGVLKVYNANIENLNASKITSGTLNNARIMDYSLGSQKIDDYAITNRTIDSQAVSYGKTSFQGTLDQVGTNKANIDTLYGYFEGSASFSSVLTGSLAINWHYLGLETITIGGVNRKVVTWT